MLIAYYCFVNLNWPPDKYDALPAREKALVRAFALRSMEKRREETKRMKEAGQNG